VKRSVEYALPGLVILVVGLLVFLAVSFALGVILLAMGIYLAIRSRSERRKEREAAVGTAKSSPQWPLAPPGSRK